MYLHDPFELRPLAATFADAMGRADGCPADDCDNTQPPRAAIPWDGDWMTNYLCADCGRTWTRKE